MGHMEWSDIAGSYCGFEMTGRMASARQIYGEFDQANPVLKKREKDAP